MNRVTSGVNGRVCARARHGHFKLLYHSPGELRAVDVYAAIVSVHCCLQPVHGEAMDLKLCASR